MRRFTPLFLLLLLFTVTTPLTWAVGTVTVTCAAIGNGNYTVTYAWVGDAAGGTVPATTAPCMSNNATTNMQGYRVFQVETIPASPAPTNNYTMTLKDAQGVDYLAGTTNALSATVAAMWPVNAPAVSGTLTMAITGNAVNSAQGSVVVYVGPQATARLFTAGALVGVVLPVNGGTGEAGTITGIPKANGAAAFTAASGHDVAGVLTCPTTSASTTAEVCNTSPTFTPAAGDSIIFQADVANTGAFTLNVNSQGAKPVKKNGTAALVANDILATPFQVVMTYDGTNWQMQGQLGNAAASPAIGGAVTSGTTGSVLFVDAGPILAQDNANFFWSLGSHQLYLGHATGAALLDGLATSTEVGLNLNGTQPASVGSGTGTAGQAIVTIVGPTGGNTTDTTAVAGGLGSTLSLTAGTGGTNASTTTSASPNNRGGNGGSLNITSGTGGAATGGAGNAKGGAGGAFTLTSGGGGASLHGTAGAGGAFIVQPGTGGNNTTAGAGGQGGTLSFTGASGGIGTTTSGAGSAISILAGSGGNAFAGSGGNGGNGGAVTMDAGTFGALDGGGANGTAGTVTIGGSNASAIGIGRSGITTTINGTWATGTNCSSSASPAVCAAAPAGSVVVAAAATTVVVNTTAVTANSQIFVMYDSSLGTKLGVTCNTTEPGLYGVTARTATTSFTISATAPITNPACFSYLIIN